MTKLEPDDMHGATGLWHRNGVYYFRLRIPDDLKSLYEGKPEIRFSLKTKDKREAQLRASAERHKLLREFDSRRKLRDKLHAERGSSRDEIVVRLADPDFIEYVCATRLRMSVENDEYFRFTYGEDWRDFVRSSARDKETYPSLKRALATGNIELIRPLLSAHLQLMGIRLECPEEEYRKLAFRFLQTVVKELDLLFSRDEGNVVETDIVAPVKKLTQTALTLHDLFVAWRDATPRLLKTTETFERVVGRFATFVNNKSPELITRRDVLAFRDFLLAGNEMRRPLTLKAVKTHIDCLKAIFRRAVANELIANDPFQQIPFDKPTTSAKVRLPFDHDELQRIFSTPIYIAHQYDVKAGGHEASYWLPLLALFTGARLEELGQLRVLDIKKHPELGYFLDITPDAGKLKTKSSERHVPLHPELFRLGFVEYVDSMRKAGHQRVFPHLSPDKFGKITSAWSKWFGRHLDKIGISDKRKVFHSFRHGFKDAARANGISEEIHDALTGHANGAVGRSYGDQRYPLTPLFKAIAQITYPGLAIGKAG